MDTNFVVCVIETKYCKLRNNLLLRAPNAAFPINILTF